MLRTFLTHIYIKQTYHCTTPLAYTYRKLKWEKSIDTRLLNTCPTHFQCTGYMCVQIMIQRPLSDSPITLSKLNLLLCISHFINLHVGRWSLFIVTSKHYISSTKLPPIGCVIAWKAIMTDDDILTPCLLVLLSLDVLHFPDAENSVKLNFMKIRLKFKFG